jgi:hypothetical protein
MKQQQQRGSKRKTAGSDAELSDDDEKPLPSAAEEIPSKSRRKKS